MQDDVWQTWGQVVRWQTCDEILEPVDGLGRFRSKVLYIVRTSPLCARYVVWSMLGWLSTAEMLRRF